MNPKQGKFKNPHPDTVKLQINNSDESILKVARKKRIEF